MKIFNKIIIRFFSKIKKIYFRYFKKHLRLSSEPYISGDTFRKLAKHILDDSSSLKLKNIKNGDIIFIKSDYIELFFKKFISQLPNDIKLISHNSDNNIINIHEKTIRQKNISWFAQNLNVLVKNEVKVYPLPIGFENRNWLKNGKIKNLKNTYNTELKSNSIICTFNPQTNPTRKDIYKLLENNLNVTKFINYDHKFYLQELSKHKLAICPEGNGLDTHRIWESLLVKTLPVVLKSNFSLNFKNLGVPLLLVESWSELKEFDKSKIENTYFEYKNKITNNEFTKIEYWKKFIYDN